MIQVENITKSFDGKTILNEVSTVFEKGKLNLIIGQSGSGKTVLLKTVVGLLEPDTGNIFFDGRNFTTMSEKERKAIRKEIGMVFQGSALFDSSTILENVLFPLEVFANEMSRTEQIDRAKFCLDKVGLSHAFDKYPAEISGGMQKRAAIARAITLNPKYLFCDEPNSGLDPKTAQIIDELIQELTYEFNMTTIINTHDLSSMVEIGDHILFIHKGENRWHGNKNELLSSGCESLEEFITSSSIIRKLERLK
jgi:phospholipid/cholesterol/gamma-HCH transport system ATP-binding protein